MNFTSFRKNFNFQNHFQLFHCLHCLSKRKGKESLRNVPFLFAVFVSNPKTTRLCDHHLEVVRLRLGELRWMHGTNPATRGLNGTHQLAAGNRDKVLGAGDNRADRERVRRWGNPC